MIEKRYYNATTLTDAIEVYERHYGMPSDEFYAAHRADAIEVRGIPGFQRSLWTGLWRELHELGERDVEANSLADHLCRRLQPA